MLRITSSLITELRNNPRTELCSEAANELEKLLKILEAHDIAVARSAIKLLHSFGLEASDAEEIVNRVG